MPIKHDECLNLKLFTLALTSNSNQELNYSDLKFVYLRHFITISRHLHYFNFGSKQAADNFSRFHRKQFNTAANSEE